VQKSIDEIKMKTVQRAIDLLEFFSAERPTLSVSEIAKLLSVHKSIASRLAASLCARHLLQLDNATHRYRVGIRVYELGQLYSHDTELEVVAEPLLRALTRSVGHASHVCVLDNMEIYTVCCVPSAQRLQVIVEVGGRRPLHATAAGKLFLAYGPEELFDALSPNGKFPKITTRTIESRIAMRREIAVIKKYGIAHNREESYAGASAVAAPIYSDDSVIIASLTTIFPVALVTPSDMLQIETEVRETARRITEGLSKHTKQHHPKPLRRISS